MEEAVIKKKKFLLLQEGKLKHGSRNEWLLSLQSSSSPGISDCIQLNGRQAYV